MATRTCMYIASPRVPVARRLSFGIIRWYCCWVVKNETGLNLIAVFRHMTKDAEVAFFV